MKRPYGQGPSKSAERRTPRFWAPRWIISLWLWLNTPLCAMNLLNWPGPTEHWRRPVENTISFAFGQFPTSIMWGFPLSVPRWATIVIMISLTAICWLLIRRFLPERMSIPFFVLFSLGWIVFSDVTAMFALGLMGYDYDLGALLTLQ